MFETELILMERKTQQIPGGTLVVWGDKLKFQGIMQFSNSMSTRIAVAGGVTTNGTLSVPLTMKNKLKFDDYVKDPKTNMYGRIADGGVVESGEGIFQTVQYAVQQTNSLPK